MNFSIITRSLFVFLVLLSLPAGAWKVYRTYTGRVLHWTQKRILMIGDINGTKDVPGNAEWQAVEASMDTWNKVHCNQPQLLFGGLKSDVVVGFWPGVQNTNVIRWVDDKKEWIDRYGDVYGDVIAFTTVSFDQETGEILDADMEINDWNFYFTVSDNLEETVFDVQNAVTHEMGHVLGLDHSTDPEATMYYSADEHDLNKRTLEQDDIQGLCFIYKDPDHWDSSGDYTADSPLYGDLGINDTTASGGPFSGQPPSPRGRTFGCTQNTRSPHGSSVLFILVFSILLIKWRGDQAPQAPS